MKKLKKQQTRNFGVIGWFVLAILALAALLIYRLGSLTHGLSQQEVQTSTAAVGWHGIYHSPLDLPLKALRSVVFYIFPSHGQTLTRLPNAAIGGLTIMSFSWLAYLWHGRRTAIFASVLFASSAWVLHVSRYASYDVVYLWAMTTLLLTHALLHHYKKQALVWYLTLLLWGVLLTIPGMIWFLVPSLYLQRSPIRNSWRAFGRWWQRILAVIILLLWVPLLGVDLSRSGQLKAWLGLPNHLAAPAMLLKQFGGVFVHLFLRGPQYPTLWLGRAPLLDAFTLAMCALGIYFYGSRWRTGRSRLLERTFGIGVILVALQGPVSLSILVPVVYAAAAMGIAYLLHEWLQVFPLNPLARSLGIGIVALAVAASCTYNLRAYFIAWPHNTVTQTTFRYHL
ncbi:MAG TPA: hypothetical protein VNG32_04435 [Candidatus Dormibacteraeota bacterium]|nr:hypothetical protein [Candidatus Dormibacteraeota bacterium]